jgi:hypothetical protein
MAEPEQNEVISTQEFEGKEKSDNSRTFSDIFAQYSHSIEAIREFFSRLSPLVAGMQEGIVKERETYLKEIFHHFLKDAKKEDIQELQNVFSSLQMYFYEPTPETNTESLEIKSAAVGNILLKVFRHLYHSPKEDIHRELLNRSILMCLVSHFEVLVADLAHAFYRIAPDAISTDDKVLSVKELKRFSSIDEALRSIVSNRVDDLLRGSVNDWRKFFESRMNIDMINLVPDWARWEEYFQRRHIFMHAGGRATERYLSNVDWGNLSGHIERPREGEKMDIPDFYLQNAIDTFQISGLLLCQEVWRKLAPTDSDSRHSSTTGLTSVVYDCLLTQHWNVSERLAAWGEKDPQLLKEDTMLIYEFNRWLSIKRQGRWTEVEKEVEAFDCSAKNRKYAMARASLLERADEFFKLLPKALGTDINTYELQEWPIFQEMHTDPRFAKIIKKTNG